MGQINIGQGIIPFGTSSSFTISAFDFSSGGDNTVISGVANKTIRIFRLFLVCSASTSITFKNGASTNLSGALSMSANGGMTFDLSTEPWFYCTSGNSFIINQSGTAQIGGRIWYQQS